MATNHALNWLRPSQMVCGVSVEGRIPVQHITGLTCERCILRILRTGVLLGWDESQIRFWDLGQMAIEWTSERAQQNRNI